MIDFNVAVVGTGFMGFAHIEALRRLSIPVLGIMGSSPEKSEDARGKLGLKKAYALFDDILTDDEINVVHLCVPNDLHFDFARKALLAGKHVMCEKPLAMNAMDSEELVVLAKSQNLAAAVCYNLRFYPLNLHVKQIIQQKDMGNIFHINGSYVQDWLLYDTDYNWRLLSEKSGNLRVISDIGTHWLDLMETITGLEIDSVFADLKIFHPTRCRPSGEVETYSQNKVNSSTQQEFIDIDTEDYGSLLIRFKGGATGSLYVSQVVAGRKNCLRYEISGSKQAVSWDSERPNELWIGHRDRANETMLRDPSLISKEAAGYCSYPGGHNEGYSDTFKQCFKSFYQYISVGDFEAAKDFPTFEEGHRQILLCEAILKSSQREQWVKLKGKL